MKSRRALCALLLGAVSVSGCNTTASHELAVAIDNYDARSREAIAAIELFQTKAREQPPVSDAEAERRFVAEVLDSQSDVDDAFMVEAVHPNAPPAAGESLPLAEMRCDHRSFTAAFAQLETAGIFGKSSVAARAPGVLDALVAQQLAMTKHVQNPEYSKLLLRRVAVASDVEDVRASSEPREAKEQALAALRTQWLAIEREEEQLRAAALQSLLKAAATGLALRDQIEQYGRWSLSDLKDSLAGLTGFISDVTGRDLAGLNGRIAELEGLIANDPALRALVEDAAAGLPVLGPDGSVTAAGGGGRPAVAAARGNATPCLDRAPLEIPEAPPAEPAQPDAAPPAAPQPAPEPEAPPQARAADSAATMGA